MQDACGISLGNALFKDYGGFNSPKFGDCEKTTVVYRLEFLTQRHPGSAKDFTKYA